MTYVGSDAERIENSWNKFKPALIETMEELTQNTTVTARKE